MAEQDRAKRKVIVVGAGIVGASIGYHLAKRGADVVILDRAGMAAGATGKSFAWINAHHVKSESYHRLRYQSLAEYRRLDQELDGSLGLNWCGALSFDLLGEAFDQRFQEFRRLGYPADVLSHQQFQTIEPGYSQAPGRALHLPMEAAIDPAVATKALIAGALEYGAKTLLGDGVETLRHEHGRVTGIETALGTALTGDVVLAAGVGAKAILESVGVDLPMANRFGVMLHSRPVKPTLNHVIWGDRIHLKQNGDGRIVIGEIFSEEWTDRDPDAIAGQMLADAKRHLPEIDLKIDHITIGERPIPKDGMPIVGGIEGWRGLYVAVMHSGVTLAPIVGRLAAEELLEGVSFEMLNPYRLNRFQEPSKTAIS